MDVLYSDLENYEEVYAIERLRKENQELKLKLEENEKAMVKLQKDFDMLDSEFHKLQINYSSLLKTARAEVERKAQIITQLNLEKDMKIIQSPQNRMSLDYRNKYKKCESSNTEKRSKTDQTPKDDELKSERCEISSISTNISMPSVDNTKLNIVDRVIERVEACINKDKLKENIQQCEPKDKKSHIRASAISNRRKSAPVDRLPKFSSDEESDPDTRMIKKIKNDIPPSNTCMTRNINTCRTRSSNDRFNTITSETSSMDGRSYRAQDNARYNNSNRASRNYDYEKRDRERDRGRQSDRNRECGRLRELDRNKDRHWEIDKYRTIDRFRESGRESDKYRGRNKYDSSHRYKQNYSPDRPYKRPYREYQDDLYRPEYGKHKRDYLNYETSGHYSPRSWERQSDNDEHYYDDDRNIHRFERRSIGKIYDLPNSKRQKIESEVHLDENHRYQGNEPFGRLAQSDAHQYDMLRTSCQSPDVVHLPECHADLPSTIKEIKSIASVPLDDPRVTSKKYILKTENGKPILYTASSQSIDIKSLNKSWNRPSVAVPEPLLHRPDQSDFTVENIEEICMNIENKESKESERNSYELMDVIHKNNREIMSDRISLSSNSSKNGSAQQTKDYQNETKATPSHKIVQQVSENADTYATNVSKDLPNIIGEEQITDNTKEKQCTKNNIPYIDTGNNDIIPEIRLNEKVPGCKKSEKRHVFSDIAMVQEDLELSDETSDNLELHQKTVAEVETASRKRNMETKLDDKNCKTKVNTKSEVKCDDAKVKRDVKSKDSESHNKHKTKRKKSISKEIEVAEIVEKPASDKKLSKKDKNSKPKQIKNKFSELFGDSSSLITPEDLGIPASCVPLCEDAQDAVDINIKESVKNLPTKETCNDSVIDKKITQNTNLKAPVTKEEETINSIDQIPSSANANIVYENLNFENSTKSDVVKTIIISSGVQPQIILGDRKEDDVKRVADVEVNIQNIANSTQQAVLKDLNNQNAIKALATSTPHKELHTLKTIETNYSTNDCMSNSNSSSRNDSGEISGLAVNQSDTNTQDSYDPPDVRIFVKRRRKGLKRI